MNHAKTESKRYSPGPNRPITVRVQATDGAPPPVDLAEPIVRSMLEMGPGKHDFFTIDIVHDDDGRPFWMLSAGNRVPLAMMLETPEHYEIALFEPPPGWGIWMAEFYSMAVLHFNGAL